MQDLNYAGDIKQQYLPQVLEYLKLQVVTRLLSQTRLSTLAGLNV